MPKGSRCWCWGERVRERTESFVLRGFITSLKAEVLGEVPGKDLKGIFISFPLLPFRVMVSTDWSVSVQKVISYPSWSWSQPWSHPAWPGTKAQLRLISNLTQTLSLLSADPRVHSYYNLMWCRISLFWELTVWRSEVIQGMCGVILGYSLFPPFLL